MTRQSITPEASPMEFACPVCCTPLIFRTEDLLCCPTDGVTYPRVQGIWRLLSPDRQAFYQKFIQDYETIRQAEGRGSDDPVYYQRLPLTDPADEWRTDWEIRRRSYEALIRRVIQPLENEKQRPLNILDLGAGNGWLSYRLSRRNHQVAAIDLLTNRRDGLGCYVNYDAGFIPVQAEFDHLPFRDHQTDLLVYNASFHYSTGYAATLQEAMRLLIPGGSIVIMDTPIYRHPESGVQMVQEREAFFTQRYGFASNALPSENYLTYKRLDELSDQTGLSWRLIKPFYGIVWSMRPWIARLRGRRSPAQFALIVGN
jgi:SAM-dependent methyltransferase